MAITDLIVQLCYVNASCEKESASDTYGYFMGKSTDVQPDVGLIESFPPKYGSSH